MACNCAACLSGKLIETEKNDGYYHPVKIGDIDITAESHGGKAFGLQKLIQGGFPVPTAWAFPCLLTFADNPKLSVMNVRRDVGFDTGLVRTWQDAEVPWKFAVRSGAPVSMPGMMETKLNVPFDGILDAVHEVHKSYFSDHATAYRETNGIDHGIGTGVIIQRMLGTENLVSGVCFTADRNNPLVTSFAPVTEYVRGTGDQLVGGTATPTPIKLGDYIDDVPSFATGILWDKFRQIHSAYGPSDVEWAIEYMPDIGYMVWILQLRPLKFAAVTEDQKQEFRGKTLFKGLSIGAPVRVTAPITTDPKDAKGKILYAVDFTPELYKPMMQAAGIISREGGVTCHASIVACTMGKPAVSGVSEEQISGINVPVTLDGTDGCVKIAFDEDVDAVHHELVAVYDESRTPVLGQKKSHWANWLLARLYYAVHETRHGKLSQQVCDAVVKDTAHLFCAYFYTIVCAEARHMWAKTYRATDDKTELMKYLASSLEARGVEIPFTNNQKGRDGFISCNINSPRSLKEAIAVMSLCYRLYNEFKWNGSYGGPKWGTIAEMVLMYLTGMLNDLLFVDACFNLCHNGGTAFGKFELINVHGSMFETQLNARRTGDMHSVLNWAYNANAKCYVDGMAGGYKAVLQLLTAELKQFEPAATEAAMAA